MGRQEIDLDGPRLSRRRLDLTQREDASAEWRHNHGKSSNVKGKNSNIK